MNIDVKKPDGSGLASKFTPAAEPTELRVSEMIDFHGAGELDSMMTSIEAGRHLSHSPV